MLSLGTVMVASVRDIISFKYDIAMRISSVRISFEWHTQNVTQYKSWTIIANPHCTAFRDNDDDNASAERQICLYAWLRVCYCVRVCVCVTTWLLIKSKQYQRVMSMGPSPGGSGARGVMIYFAQLSHVRRHRRSVTPTNSLPACLH